MTIIVHQDHTQAPNPLFRSTSCWCSFRIQVHEVSEVSIVHRNRQPVGPFEEQCQGELQNQKQKSSDKFCGLFLQPQGCSFLTKSQTFCNYFSKTLLHFMSFGGSKLKKKPPVPQISISAFEVLDPPTQNPECDDSCVLCP